MRRNSSRYIDLTQELDDGEAMTAAVAIHRRLPVVTDDRKALRVLERHALASHSTLDLVRNWSEQASVDSDDVANRDHRPSAAWELPPGEEPPPQGVVGWSLDECSSPDDRHRTASPRRFRRVAPYDAPMKIFSRSTPSADSRSTSRASGRSRAARACAGIAPRLHGQSRCQLPRRPVGRDRRSRQPAGEGAAGPEDRLGQVGGLLHRREADARTGPWPDDHRLAADRPDAQPGAGREADGTQDRRPPRRDERPVRYVR